MKITTNSLPEETKPTSRGTRNRIESTAAVQQLSQRSLGDALTNPVDRPKSFGTIFRSIDLKRNSNNENNNKNVNNASNNQSLSKGLIQSNFKHTDPKTRPGARWPGSTQGQDNGPQVSQRVPRQPGRGLGAPSTRGGKPRIQSKKKGMFVTPYENQRRRRDDSKDDLDEILEDDETSKEYREEQARLVAEARQPKPGPPPALDMGQMLISYAPREFGATEAKSGRYPVPIDARKKGLLQDVVRQVRRNETYLQKDEDSLVRKLGPAMPLKR
jgi:hypothetical protein